MYKKYSFMESKWSSEFENLKRLIVDEKSPMKK